MLLKSGFSLSCWNAFWFWSAWKVSWKHVFTIFQPTFTGESSSLEEKRKGLRRWKKSDGTPSGQLSPPEPDPEAASLESGQAGLGEEKRTVSWSYNRVLFSADWLTPQWSGAMKRPGWPLSGSMLDPPPHGNGSGRHKAAVKCEPHTQHTWKALKMGMMKWSETCKFWRIFTP